MGNVGQSQKKVLGHNESVETFDHLGYRVEKGYVYQLRAPIDPSEDKLKPVYYGNVPHHHNNPLLIFIETFLRNPQHTGAYNVMQSVIYNENPHAVLLIIEHPPNQKGKRFKNAYLCESTAGTLAFARKGLPHLLPFDNQVFDHDDMLDLTRLPEGSEFRECLQNFKDNQLEILACSVCSVRLADTWLVSCGHMVMCVTCARNVSTCPMCRIAIPSKGRFVLPEVFRTSDLITKAELEYTMDALKVVQKETGWILGELQLGDQGIF